MKTQEGPHNFNRRENLMIVRTVLVVLMAGLCIYGAHKAHSGFVAAQMAFAEKVAQIEGH